jgi:tetratricopeptide (TPR) repeat protein
MQALTPEEFTAVIAHEFGHLSRSHGRFSSFVYRIRSTWDRLLGALEINRHWGRMLFSRFFGWYAPYFSAYSFALIRSHEYDADQAAAEVAGPRTTAAALAALTVADRYLGGSYWPGIFARIESEAGPPTGALSGMAVGLTEARTGDQQVEWLEAALCRPADTTDTHPSLADRLIRLGVVPPETVIATQKGAAETAAQHFLGSSEAELADQLDRAWTAAIGPRWAEERAEELGARRRFADLGEKERSTLSEEEFAEYVYLAARFREQDEALPLLEELVVRDPGQAAAHFLLGSILLRRGEDRGLEHLERAMSLAPDSTFAASELAVHYLDARGRKVEADAYRRRTAERAEVLESGRVERLKVSTRGPFEPHVLPPEQVEALGTALAGVKKLKRAYVARKPMKHLDDEFPLHVLFILPGGFVYDRQKLVDQVGELAPFDGWIVSPRSSSWARRKLERVPGAKVYER